MDLSVVFPESIKRWDEAIPLGNGKIGTLIWGNPEEIRFSLDRTDIWDKSPPLHHNSPSFTYNTLVNLAHKSGTREIRELFDEPYNFPTPTKLPAGKILLSFCKKNGQNHLELESTLDLTKALATLTVYNEEKTVIIKAICHSVSQTGMISVGASLKNLDFSFRLAPVIYGEPESVENQDEKYDPEHRTISQGSLKQLHYPKVEEFQTRDENGEITMNWFIQKVQGDFAYGIVVGCQEFSHETLIFYRVVTSEDGENWIEKAENQIKKELSQGFEKNLQSHESWWKEFWGKSSISLPDSFMEKQWYISNYLFASCSRKGSYPMPLQGVWTADDGNLPPWKGDYHNDLNTQFCYCHFYKANHLEEGMAFIDFLWNLMPEARKFAKQFYGTDGICLPGVMTIDGKALGGWPMYSLSPTHQIWLCLSFINYYKFTGDEDFLRNRAWIYTRETGLCISQLLKQKENGLYYLPVSSSPEIHDDEKESWLTPNSNYDLSLLYYLFKNLVEMAEHLFPENNNEKEKWQHYLKHLPKLAVNDKNVLMLSPDESLNESHRHLSNAMGIFPLEILDYNNPQDKKIIDATVSDYERLGTGYWVGFTFPWMSHLYAIQGNGEGAWNHLRIFWENFCSKNGFHLNGDFKKRGYTTFHYRPFTLEANMLSADALQEMLFQMRNGVVMLFHGIPESWKEQEVSFTRFLGEKGLLVSGYWKNNSLRKVIFESKCPQTIILKMESGEEKTIILDKNQKKIMNF